MNIQIQVVVFTLDDRRLRLPDRDIALTDQLVIARTARRCGHLRPAGQSQPGPVPYPSF